MAHCFLRRTLKWWKKLFFWGLEVSIINAYILYVESCKNSNSNAMSHIKFRRELVMALVGDFRQGGGGSTRRRMTEWKAACDYPTSREKTQRLHSVLQTKCAR